MKKPLKNVAETLPYKERKTRDIILAARELFLEHGVEAVTIEEIAEAAGVAKTTIYYKFGRKEEVFAAVVAQLSEEATADFPGEFDANDPPREVLNKLCRRLVTALAKRKMMGPEPLFLLEAKRDPELGKHFFEIGPGRVRAIFRQLIEDWVSQGYLEVTDVSEAAEDISVLCQGLLPLQLLLFPKLTLSDDEVERRVIRGVEKFLLIYGRRPE